MGSTGGLAQGSRASPVGRFPSGIPAHAEYERWLFSDEGWRAPQAWGSVVTASGSRPVPWKRILRVARVGVGLAPEAYTEAADTFARLAEKERALRLHVELWEPQAEARAALRRTLRTRGFEPVAVPRTYTHTFVLDLARSEDDIFASCSFGGRRNIRMPGKLGLLTAPITEERFVARLEALDAETMGRTGG